jgi:hypothetical protein
MIASPAKWTGAKIVAAAVVALTALIVTSPGSKISTPAQPHELALAESPSCEWRGVQAPSPGVPWFKLRGVEVLSPNDVWAVGSFTPSRSSHTQLLAMHWDGHDWSLVTTPQFAWPSTLFAVAAASPKDIWAVGTQKVNFTRTETVFLHWDGRSWTDVPGPNPGLIDTFLYDIEAISADNAWAVGAAVDVRRKSARTFVAHWDGELWTVAPSPNSAARNSLHTVFALSATDVWAGGFARDDDNPPYEMLIERWDGVRWRIFESPSTSASGQLWDIGGVSKNDVWVVGRYLDDPSRALIEHWDGNSWNTVPSSPIGELSVLQGVTALSPRNAWAVGYSRDAHSVATRTLIQHWNGDYWDTVPSADMIPGTSSRLQHIAALSPNHIWAVGETFSAEERTLEPLIQKYCSR